MNRSFSIVLHPDNEFKFYDMRKQVFLSGLVALFVCILFTSCNNNEPHSLKPSYRDGKYEGKNLTVFLNGEELTTVAYVTIRSELIDNNLNPDTDGDSIEMDPVYHSQVTIEGFPGRNDTFTFAALSDLEGFEGITKINVPASIYYGQYVEFVGEFTGDPLTAHDQQGLILKFVFIDSPL